MVINSLSK